MDDRQARQLWESVRRRVREWWGGDEGHDAESNEEEADPAMLFNASPILLLNNTYGPNWLRPVAVLPGRLFKFGAQLDF